MTGPDEERTEETLLAGFLARREAGEELEFEAWVESHPEHEEALRALYAEHRALEALLAQVGDRGPFLELERITQRARDADRYRFEGEIARGGQGSVVRVYDEDLRRHLAMKIILGRVRENRGDTPVVDSRSLGRFLEEARITGQLDHPGIVPIHELGVDQEERAYFTMKLVRGRNLRDVLASVAAGEDGWTVPRVLSVLLRVCEALAYAHAKDVVHRDLKPSNIMVGEFGEVYVMDWGLARMRDAPARAVVPEAWEVGDAEGSGSARTLLRTRDGDVVGTPAYMSPEQARGDHELVDEQSDVYSVGAILLQLMTGRPPYDELGPKATAVDIWRAVCKRAPAGLDELRRPCPAGIGEELLSIARRAMARERERRYASARELADDLRAYLEGRVVRAHEAGALAELRKWIRRNRTLSTVVAASFVLLSAAGFAFAYVQERRAELALAEQARLELELDLRTARELVQRAQDPPPLHPEHTAAWERWVAEHDALEASRASYARRRDELLARAETVTPVPAAEADRRRLEPRLRTLRSFAEGFEAIAQDPSQDAATRAAVALEVPLYRSLARRVERSLRPAEDPNLPPRERSELAILTELTQHLNGLADPVTGDAAWMRARAREAAELRTRTIEAARERWSHALAAIADPTVCPAYAGLELTPQIGLVPLRQDPRSGLWEFWHAASGDEPRLGPDDRWAIEPATGIVLVLVPGGTTRIGVQSSDPQGEHYEPLAQDQEGPPREVELDPYLLSKYELTQGQWIRAMRSQPSEHFAGKSTMTVPRISRTHPVERVSWHDAMDALAFLGLTLPTEAQWERAARAGGDARYGATSDFAEAAERVNYADQSYFDVREIPPGEAPTHDGYLYHAPVGTFRPNAFGFHDMLGNVREWMLDRQVEVLNERFLVEVRPGSGELVPALSLHHAVRGGGYAFAPEDLRISLRQRLFPSSVADDLGVRPCRRLDP